MSKSKDTYITFRASRQLKEELNEYVRRHGTTLTKLTLDFYRSLLESEGKQEAEQV